MRQYDIDRRTKEQLQNALSISISKQLISKPLRLWSTLFEWLFQQEQDADSNSKRTGSKCSCNCLPLSHWSKPIACCSPSLAKGSSQVTAIIQHAASCLPFKQAPWSPDSFSKHECTARLHAVPPVQSVLNNSVLASCLSGSHLSWTSFCPCWIGTYEEPTCHEFEQGVLLSNECMSWRKQKAAGSVSSDLPHSAETKPLQIQISNFKLS